MSGLFNAYRSRAVRALALIVALGLAGCGSAADRAQSHYQQGMKLLEQKDYVKAALEFRNAVKLKKDLLPAWRELSQIEERNQNWEAAAGILRTIVQLDPTDIEMRLRLGRLMLFGNALDEALKLVDAAGEAASQHAGALAFKAAVYLRLNDAVGAVREARSALEIDPVNVEALIVLAAERVVRGDTEGALLMLGRTDVADVKNIGVQIFKLAILERTGDVKQAEALLHKLIDAYPQEPGLRRQLVKFYVEQKRPDDAEREIRALAEIRPEDTEAALDVARFLNMVKGPGAARQELMARINAGGQVFQFQIALAELHFVEGHVEEAERLLESIAGKASSRAQALTAQVKLAEMHLNRKKVDAAESLVAKILKEDNRNINGLKLRARIRLDRGELDAAIADLRQGLNDQPRSTELMTLLAVAYERGGKIELADKQFADAIKTSNFDSTIGLNYVSFLQRRGNVARAEDVLTELAGRQPNNVQILAALGNVRLARQNWMGAQEIAESIRRVSNDNALPNQILAASLSGRSRYDESIGLLQSAYAAAPNSLQPIFALVNTYVRADKADRAVAFLQTVLEKNPANAEAQVLLGSTQLIRNEPNEALNSFKKAIERQPKGELGYTALANFYIRQNNQSEALKVIQAGLREQPESFVLRLALAGVAELTGDYDAAIAEYERLLKQQPGSLVVANNLASLLSDHRADQASLDRAYALAASLRKADTPQFKDTLGWVHYQRGEHKAAVPLLEEAATALPTIALVRYHLGLTYVAIGENAKAAEQFNKALELAPNDNQLGEKVRTALRKTAG
jgi:putative PEP-CTERM system TPR-repeat lipoprotein